MPQECFLWWRGFCALRRFAAVKVNDSHGKSFNKPLTSTSVSLQSFNISNYNSLVTFVYATTETNHLLLFLWRRAAFPLIFFKHLQKNLPPNKGELQTVPEAESSFEEVVAAEETVCFMGPILHLLKMHASCATYRGFNPFLLFTQDDIFRNLMPHIYHSSSPSGIIKS